MFLSSNKKNYEESLPYISLTIPAHNEEDAIKHTIKSLQELNYPRELLEIIVIDDGSVDKTADAAEKLGVKVIRKEKNEGKAKALNLGIKEAKGEIFGVVDADSYPEKDALLNMVGYFEDKYVAAVTSSILVNEPENFLQRLQDIEYSLIAFGRKLLDYVGSVYVTPGPLSLYKKEILKKVNGFNEGVLTEDIEIAWRLHRLGYKIKMAIHARVYTDVPKNFKKWWYQRLRWDIGGIQTTKLYRDVFFKREYGIFGLFIVPFFSLSIVISLIGLSLFLYLLLKNLLDFFFFGYYAFILGINPFEYYSFNFLPNLFTVLGLLTFFLSISYVLIGLKAMKGDGLNFKLKTWIEVLMYLSLYLFMFPILLVQSFWRLLRYKEGRQRW